MVDRLSPLDASFLYLEDETTPMHVGSVAVLRPGRSGLDHAQLCALVERRLVELPRYRQRVRAVPGGLSRPVWTDDPSFDVTYHVRRSVVPRPGSTEQLRELIARVAARRLDRNRPLWELYLVEGLRGGRVALIGKTHEAMVNGAAVDLAQVILDPTRSGPAERVPQPRPAWSPAPEPSDLALLAAVAGEVVRRPSELLESLRVGLLDARSALSTVAGAAGTVLTAARTAARPAPPSPLNTEVGEQRRFAMVQATLDDHRKVRAAHGCTVNDVVLATVAGALRAWLMTRGMPISPRSVVRAMVPVSVQDGGGEHSVGAAGARVAACLVDLPVGEQNPAVRLHQIAYAMRSRRQTGHFVGADTLLRRSDFAPPTLHALGVRATAGLSRRLYNLVVTNVPGPQQPRYLLGGKLEETYPVVPLARGQALAVGVTSYLGKVHYGLNADRDALSDLDVLADLFEEALAEMVEASWRS